MKYRHEAEAKELINQLCYKEEGLMHAEKAVFKLSWSQKRYYKRYMKIRAEMEDEAYRKMKEKEAQEAVEKAVQEAVEKAVQEAVEKAVQEAVEKAVQEAVEKAVQEANIRNREEANIEAQKKQKHTAKNFASMGIPHENIAKAMEISIDELQRILS